MGQAASQPDARARIGCVQWQMRLFGSPQEFLRQAELQLRSLAAAGCDLVLFPEFFSVPLTGLWPTLSDVAALRRLAELTPGFVQEFSRLAVAHRINVVAGSLPLVEGGALYNVAWLCRRDGSVDAQYKLHPTPGEVRDWQMQGGNRLGAFDTDIGRIGILVCYDVEFPELPRLLAEAGIDLLCVPFWTENKSGYLRVRLCAQARAIENECYVAIAGSTGSLPQVPCIDNQYAGSAVFSPSDIGFPHDAVVAEATANTETVLLAELDFGRLRLLRSKGAVRNAADRRRDLYRVQWLGPAGE